MGNGGTRRLSRSPSVRHRRERPPPDLRIGRRILVLPTKIRRRIRNPSTDPEIRPQITAWRKFPKVAGKNEWMHAKVGT